MAADPYRYFRVEAAEILENLQKGLLELERGSSTAETVAKLLRLAHTLKGAARVVKQKGIADLSHAVEDLLVPLRDSGASADAGVIGASLRCVDSMREQLAALSPAVEGPRQSESKGTPASTEPAVWTAKPNLEDLDALMDGIAELTVQLSAVRHSGGRMAQARGLAEVLGDHLSKRRTPNSSHSDAARLRGLVEELELALVEAERHVSRGIELAVRELGQIRDSAERLRLVPAEQMWSVLERTARDAALALGKTVRFEALGGDVRLEADLLGQVQQALVQAVRNAVAHGIELPAERAAAGKSNTGTIAIEVQRRDKHVSFSCRDDGRGLDLDAVRRSAERRGVPASALAGLDADGLAHLLMQGGISTSTTVTAVSGRGIGLDLIREVAEKLGGSVQLRSHGSSGTTISLIVPVSLSALPALLVEVLGQVVAVPLSAVRGTARRLPQDVTHTVDGDTVVWEGKVVPYTPLGRLVDASTQEMSRSQSAVLVAANDGAVALGVERLLGIESIIVRGLPQLALLSPVVSGASFDADGSPRLVLSPDGVVQAAQEAAATPGVAIRPRAPILVIDDSLTTRMLEQSILESAGYEVDLAVSGEEGMAKAKLRKYALFLVDVEMPGMDGFTFIQRTRDDPELREVPAILVTSRASPEDVERGRAAGALAHIEKREFNQTDLLERIRKLVS